MQQRLYELTDEPPDNLYLATFSQPLTGGLCDQLTEFLDANPDTNLVIIDTLQKVRGSGGDGNLYASDYSFGNTSAKAEVGGQSPQNDVFCTSSCFLHCNVIL